MSKTPSRTGIAMSIRIMSGFFAYCFLHLNLTAVPRPQGPRQRRTEDGSADPRQAGSAKSSTTKILVVIYYASPRRVYVKKTIKIEKKKAYRFRPIRNLFHHNAVITVPQSKVPGHNDRGGWRWTEGFVLFPKAGPFLLHHLGLL